MKTILFFLCFFVSLGLQAQQKRKQTIILNDGSKYTGTIVSDTNDSIKMVITKPETIAIGRNQIAFMDGGIDPFQMLSRDKGYYIQFAPSLLAGKNDMEGIYTISFHLSNGYQFSNGLSLGIGTGAEHLGFSLLPLYAEFNYHPWSKLVSPYIYLKSGYSFAFGSDEEIIYYDSYYPSNSAEFNGGFMFNIGVGILNYTWNRAAITVGVGYRYQRVSEKRNPYWWGGYSLERVTDFNRIEIKFGFIFR